MDVQHLLDSLTRKSREQQQPSKQTSSSEESFDGTTLETTFTTMGTDSDETSTDTYTESDYIDRLLEDIVIRTPRVDQAKDRPRTVQFRTARPASASSRQEHGSRPSSPRQDPHARPHSTTDTRYNRPPVKHRPPPYTRTPLSSRGAPSSHVPQSAAPRLSPRASFQRPAPASAPPARHTPRAVSPRSSPAPSTRQRYGAARESSPSDASQVELRNSFGTRDELVYSTASDGSTSDDMLTTTVMPSMTTRTEDASDSYSTSNDGDDHVDDDFQDEVASVTNYVPLAQLGKGNFGRVNLVRHKKSSKHYAMKVIDVSNPSEPWRRSLAINECLLTSAVRHPNIIGYHQAMMAGDSVCIVLELCMGGNLKEKLRREPGLWPEAKAMMYLVPVCLALKHCHANHIFHRDVKTDNVFFCEDGTVRLGDFGLSVHLPEGQLCNEDAGSRKYISPEIVQHFPYDRSSDMWSLGVTMFEILNGGVLPFHGEGNALASSIIYGWRSPLNPIYSGALRSIVDLLLQQAPEKRPTISEVLAMPIFQEYLDRYLKTVSPDHFAWLVSSLYEEPRPELATAELRQRARGNMHVLAMQENV